VSTRSVPVLPALLAALALSLVVGGSAATAGDATASSVVSRAVHGAPGIGDPYFPEDGNGGIDVRSYDVHDTYSFDRHRLSGWTTVTLRTTERLTSFDLDFLLPVRSVRLSTGESTFSRPTRHELRIVPRHALARGERVRVRVEYAGHPARYSYAHESNWMDDGHEAMALNEPHMAPWWFPSNDHPLDKARMDLHLTVPRGDQVVSGGRLVGVRRAGHRATYHWRAGSMATYLAFFVAGRFVVRQGVDHHLPYYLAVSRELPRSLRRAALHGLRQTPAIVAWLSRQVGPYPFDRTGGVVTALNPGFSLETQTRPTYPGGVSQILMVHELAHQWFGDSVSVHHWSDVWLNEGFATFMEQLWIQDHGGATTSSWLRGAYNSERSDASFWQLRVSDPGASHLFDWPVYERGAMTLAALRRLIGQDAFSTLLRTWTRQHAHGHGTTAAFEALASRIGGQDLTAFFDAWLVQRTKPADTAANGL
jgi:aminopeptidase N